MMIDPLPERIRCRIACLVTRKAPVRSTLKQPQEHAVLTASISCYSPVMTRQHTTAIIANREGDNSPALLSRMAAEWRRARVGVVGVLAEDNDAEGMCSAGFLRDIASGKAYSIQLDASPAGTSCHLDAAGVEDASTGLLDQIASADIIILSKFGKLEAMRKGLWPAFSTALAAGKPLLTTVSPKHAEVLKTIAPQALWLDADGEAIERWWGTTGSSIPCRRPVSNPPVSG